ncbi:RagB/SusD family nutrient uptake outer membrane protein [Pedobacter cryotolerans]|uniref:RagB/SusD family nutrient uptake outer membrane protein n=1 Tax=Pedobacter cryotolerans TaxID=2571270 RepID=A0A4U1C785_9SPHI|nr:RagB/SusD family nutrient uptake outer membrane protein [Pedobacter cryotolerans]TKC02012.1 RagB/SusD family nutrient uptake outer membrane protein [Pedobacter cryotolerans]
MKKIKDFYIKSIAVLLVVLSVSCKKTLETLPQDTIDASVALTTTAGVRASLANIYSTMKGESFYGNRFIGLGDALADNGQATNKSGRYINEVRNISGAHFNHWSGAYIAINRVNIVLEALPGIGDASDAQKTAWEGELKFLRALYHFDLVRTYAYIPGAAVASVDKGGVPLILKATTTAGDALNIVAPRATREAVYAAIYADLDEATVKAPALGAGANAKAFATKEAALALYSRVALYNKDFAKVVSVSNTLITSRGSTLLNPSNYVAGFSTKENPESLFEITYGIESESLGVNVSLQTLFTTLKARAASPKNDQVETNAEPKYPTSETAGFGDLVPTNDLLTALGITAPGNGLFTLAANAGATMITSRSNDIRNRLFEVGSVRRGNVFVECTKFLGRNGFVNTDNVPVLRIAEAYLNRAEAYAEPGAQQNVVLALADVNTIRVARGLTPAVGLTGTALMDEIMLQRRLEFAFEGHRFFDFKRKALNIPKPTTGTTVNFDSFVILPGIPVADIDASKGTLIQNQGY